jgi:putative CocE/NonD family hydrolase
MFAELVKKIDMLAHVISGIKSVCVPLSDGTCLVANVYLPRGRGPWPAVLTAFPYQIDGLGGGMFVLEGYSFVKAGYAFILADLRGHGASEGICTDPLDSLAGNDLYELVEWCAGQKWCDGRVAMQGESFGGVTAMVAAALNPPSLKAIFVNMAPASFYQNLCFPGGSLNLHGFCGAWLNYMNLTNLFPPLRIKKRPDWKTVWKKRLNAYTPYILSGAAHHLAYDDYWKKGDISVQNIKVPTYILEGWRGFSHRDGFQIYDKLRVPKKLAIGPWTHNFTSVSAVEPIDYIKDCIRWFDFWIKGKDTGIEEEPPLSIYVMGAGYWKFENQWIPEQAQKWAFHLQGDGKLGEAQDTHVKTLKYAHDPGVGTKSGLVSVFPFDLGHPHDQQEDDIRSLTFDTDSFTEDLEIVGDPRLHLTLSTKMPDAAVTARLCDVSPDGRSDLITSGWLRMSRLDGFETPEPPESGKPYAMTIDLLPTDYRIKKGNRLRLSLSLSDFPRILPLPFTGEIELYMGPDDIQKLELDVIPGPKQMQQRPSFVKPEAIMDDKKRLAIKTEEYDIFKDAESSRAYVHWGVRYNFPFLHLKGPLKFYCYSESSLVEGKPETAKVEAGGDAEFILGGERYACKTSQTLRHDGIDVSAKIWENGRIIYSKHLHEDVDLY